ncbi:NAD(P)H-hydrate dehydratase [uncultured Reyranella sp.]|uniref:NAD(P)H-hydrate dehydratase n=1 Tax=uncultured Reyranella sp. TaxID=735512 RepID=UPI00259C9A07|nr:NAD(P)H-hydrate dehydratase [uncultured Reyranella sp.]
MAENRDLLPRDELTLLTCAEMSKSDGFAIASGVPGRDLMERAGRAVAMAVMQRHGRRPVVLLCGPGNNGGDGFVAARHLRTAGWSVRLALFGSLEALKGDAAWAASTWTGAVEPWSAGLLDGAPLVVDAIFGAGLNRKIDGEIGTAIDLVNERKLTVVAVDVPSGLHGDTGEILGRAVEAETTVTFHRAKPGHYSVEGLRRCGHLRIVDICIPDGALATIDPKTWLNAPPLWTHLLRRGDIADHKYARGHLTILAGSHATGAARLAALAGRRVGAGLVTIGAFPSTLTALQAAEPGNLIVEIDDAAMFERLLGDERRNAVLIGPGSGVTDRTRGAALAALAARRRVVLDADAITVFASDPDLLFGSIDGPTVLTPHEGEFRRLFPDLAGKADKLGRARRAAARSGATILLKGPDTVIAAPDGRAVVNIHASPALATAGSGDVLAGLIGGLMAQELTPFAAASAAAWLHGECARLFGRPGLIAEDLPALLPHALQSLSSFN